MAWKGVDGVHVHTELGFGTALTQMIVCDGASNLPVAIPERNLVPDLIGGLSLQPDGFPLNRLTGKAVQILLSEAAKCRGDLFPGSRENSFFVIGIVQDIDLNANGGGKIVGVFPSFQHEGFSPIDNLSKNK